jgi:hypothetical protein
MRIANFVMYNTQQLSQSLQPIHEEYGHTASQRIEQQVNQPR